MITRRVFRKSLFRLKFRSPFCQKIESKLRVKKIHDLIKLRNNKTVEFSCDVKKWKNRKVFTQLKSKNSAPQISTLVILVKFPTRLFLGESLRFLRMNFELFWFLYKNWTEKAKKVGPGQSSPPTAEDVKTERNLRYLIFYMFDIQLSRSRGTSV